MTVYRPGAELSRSQLNDLAFDGLLIKIGSDCWISADTPLDARTRAEVVGEPAVHGTVYSHATAHWLWWGYGYAPTRLALTTRIRRRLRKNYDWLIICERSVPEAEERTLHGIPLTSKARTLFDEMRDAPWLRESAEISATHTEQLLADVPTADKDEFIDYVATQERRPHIAPIRRVLADLRMLPP